MRTADRERRRWILPCRRTSTSCPAPISSMLRSLETKRQQVLESFGIASGISLLTSMPSTYLALRRRAALRIILRRRATTVIRQQHQDALTACLTFKRIPRQCPWDGHLERRDPFNRVLPSRTTNGRPHPKIQIYFWLQWIIMDSCQDWTISQIVSSREIAVLLLMLATALMSRLARAGFKISMQIPWLIINF